MIQRVYDEGLRKLVPMAGVVPKLTASPGSIRSTGPEHGADTEEVLVEIGGYEPAEVAELLAGGVISAESGAAGS
jgi:crotonobetainyl-CoA:carnitine CoA-transferase CaiB-like acyl-CoA transferase